MNRKILFLTHRVPYPPNRGDRIRSYNMLKYFSKLGDVWLGALADEPATRETTSHLNDICKEVAIVPHGGLGRWANASLSLALGKSATRGLFHSQELHRIVNDWRSNVKFDAAVAFCSSMAPYLGDSPQNDTTEVVDLVDVDSEKWFDYARNANSPKSWLYAAEAKQVRRQEQKLAERVSAVTVVSQPEAELLHPYCPAGKVHAIRNGVDTEYFQPAAKQKSSTQKKCVFVGVLDYPPNIDGLVWFCQNVWPAVKAKVPEASLDIVGRRPTPVVNQLGNFDGVNVVGEVADVRDYLTPAAVAIAPLRIARGIQNKVLEAMAAGTPVVASAEALTGLDVIDGQDALQATSVSDWQSKLVDLLGSLDLRESLAHAGRVYVESNHSWDRQLQKFGKLLGLAADTDDHEVAETAADLVGSEEVYR